jgi:hypothetical protein
VTTSAALRPDGEDQSTSRREVLARQTRALIRAIREDDQESVEAAVIALSQSRRIFAPLVFTVAAFVMLFQGLRLVFTNWRLLLVQILPAMWIWVALIDLKVHVFQGAGFRDWHGPATVLLVLLIAVITAASFYLNAVFAFAIAAPGEDKHVRPAFALANRHLGVVLGVGLVVGFALGFSAIVVPRWGSPWFAISLGIVIWVMMLTFITVPARLVGIKPRGSRRDKLAAAAIGGTIGAIVCTPPYVIGRIGLLLLGSNVLFPLGVVLLAVGLMLQAGASGAVKAIKVSAKLAAGEIPPPVRSAGPPPGSPT